MKARLGRGFIICILLVGCSLQSERPAPVISLSNEASANYQKGSIAGSRYTVKKGDTLYSIAWGADRDFSEIAKLNKLNDPYIIFPGQQLTLRSNSKKTSTSKAIKTGVSATSATSNTSTKTTTYKHESNNKQQVNSNSAKIKEIAPSTKKVLASSTTTTYPVTTAQQNVNRDIHRPDLGIPTKVSRWTWPVKGRLISRFSAAGQGNKGIKIAGNRGDVIGAAAVGRVVYAGNALRGYGNLVIIKHSEDYLSAYAHADSILVKEKQQVQAGQAVAKMGSTGTNRVMLHFEIRYHGSSVDPLKYLPKQ
ncbi:peptidoglycan DD-metalloendopeptidase family protein [Shewanella sp. NIFS-20-20]|nr:peptidoglycan DD-metalloendopeptidase family protein [Shewanella sp. NIFS-20-20]MBV7316720.1 peptidoglycan DD-metalloendopeptidase family protein [Shewanella sp. NIFS-20-20]